MYECNYLNCLYLKNISPISIERWYDLKNPRSSSFANKQKRDKCSKRDISIQCLSKVEYDLFAIGLYVLKHTCFWSCRVALIPHYANHPKIHVKAWPAVPLWRNRWSTPSKYDWSIIHIPLLSTVETLYNTVNFCWNTHKRHSIARPKGRGMGCLLWVQRATYCVDLSRLSSIKYLL